MKSTLSYCSVSACERVRSSFQAKRILQDRRRRAMGGANSLLFAGSSLAKAAAFVVGDEPRQQGIAFRQGRCPGQAAGSLTKPVLARSCARARPAPWPGSNLAQMMSMLSACKARPNWVIPVTAERPRMVDPEDAVLVAVERHRLAPGLGDRRGAAWKYAKVDSLSNKLQVHQPARRIVNKTPANVHCGPAVFEPPIARSVDLHQFAQHTRADGAAGEHARRRLFAVEPQPLCRSSHLRKVSLENAKAVLSGELLRPPASGRKSA